ncbi:hypothetical protein ACFV4Q_13550, partial [Streptomyces nojiriensis]
MGPVAHSLLARASSALEADSDPSLTATASPPWCPRRPPPRPGTERAPAGARARLRTAPFVAAAPGGGGAAIGGPADPAGASGEGAGRPFGS